MKVELVEIPSEITEASIKQYLADCSAVVRNKQPKNNDRLYDRLLKESYGGRPSRIFEYIPCTIPPYEAIISIEECEHQQLFGFFSKFIVNGVVDRERKYHTTARELLNWGWKFEEILECVDFTHYRTLKVEAPYFLYGQASTHNQITSVSHSNRYTEADLGYWCPPEYISWRMERNTKLTSQDVQELWNNKVMSSSPVDLELYMKQCLGIKRREISARGADMLANRVYTLGGYTNNPNAWEHFINQRLMDSHTQYEMRQLAALMAVHLPSFMKEVI